MTIIGDKNVIALEYKVHAFDPIFMVYSRLWIQGKFLGNIDSSGAFYSLYNQLSFLVSENGNFYEPEFLDKSPEQVLLTMVPNLNNPNIKFKDYSGEQQERLVKYDLYLTSFGENYDSFVSRIYAKDGIYYFVWQFSPELWMETEFQSLKGYDKSIQYGVVALQDLKILLSTLQDSFPNFKI